ncbi:hypothetical protein GEMRC1_013543 [Eukaryota sp. GEM-RC1]
MSSKSKKHTSRFKLFIAYTCDTLFGSDALVLLVLLFLYSGLIASAAFSILFKSKAISFASFIAGNLIFWYVTFSSSFKEWWESINSQLKPVLFCVRHLYTPFFLHNLIWLMTYFTAYYLASYTFPINPFPLTEDFNVCDNGHFDPYYGVPWGNLSSKFFFTALAAFNFQLPLMFCFYILVIAPSTVIIDLYKDFKKSAGSDFFLLDSSSYKSLQFFLGIDIRGRLSALVLLNMPVSHFILFSFIWPSPSGKLISKIVLATCGLLSSLIFLFSCDSFVCAISYNLNEDIVDKTSSSFTKFITSSLMIYCVFMLFSILGWLFGMIYFIVDPQASSFIFISKDLYAGYPNYVDLLICLCSFLVFAAVLGIVGYLFVTVISSIVNCCKGFEEYEQKVLKSDDEKNVQYC